MTAVPLAVRIIDKSLVSDRVIVDTVVNKYCDHSPLYRQSVALLRDAGIDISRATMCGWVMSIGELLLPVVSAMRRELLSGSYIQADERGPRGQVFVRGVVKLRLMCRRTTAAAPTISLISGSTERRAVRRFLISV
jgi:hypothetical protein